MIRDEGDLLGQAVSPDKIAGDCAWLQKQGFVQSTDGVAELSELRHSTVECWRGNAGRTAFGAGRTGRYYGRFK